MDLDDRQLQAESMLLQLRHLVGQRWWDAIDGRLRGSSTSTKAKADLIESAVERARVRREKAEAAKNNKKAKVHFQDDFARKRGAKGGRDGESGKGGGERGGGGDRRMKSGNKNPLNRCHSSMN